MKLRELALPLLLLSSAFGQTFYPRTDTFVFIAAGGAITSWDGSDPNNPPYPYAMGYVELGNPTAIDIPFQLGYLNNGYLVPCDSMVWQPKMWTIGDGTHDGDAYTQSGSTTCPYFTGEYGSSGNSWNILDGFSVSANYIRHIRLSCRYGKCTKIVTDALQGGTGTTQQTEINPS